MAAFKNPAFDNPAFKDDRSAQYPGGAQGAAMGTTYAQQVSAAQSAQLEGAFAGPPADSANTGRMTIEDTVVKSAILFGVLLVMAAVGWMWTMSSVPATGMPTMAPWLIGAIGGFIMAMVVIFTSRKKVRPALIFAYAALQGLFVGGISAYFEMYWDGIVVQATLATVAVLGTTLALFASGKIRASKKATRIWMIAMIGYLVFSLLNLVLMWTGLNDNPWGLRGATIAGIPLGLILGVFVVIMAAYSLVLDFDNIKRGVQNRAPREYGWLGGFGIMVTTVWLYVEILRLIAIARGNN